MSTLARLGLPVVAIGQFAAGALQSMEGVGVDIRTRSMEGGIPPELPPGVFFAVIWGVIFTLFAIYAVVSALKNEHLYNRLAPPLVMAGLGNIVWMLSSQFIASTYLDYILLFPVAGFVWTAAYRLDEMGGFDGTGKRLLPCVLIGLFAGWISAAICLATADAVREFLELGPSDLVWPFFWCVSLCAVIIARIFSGAISRSLWFYVALGWGIAGIIVNNWQRLDQPLVAIIGAVVGLGILRHRLQNGADGSGAMV